MAYLCYHRNERFRFHHSLDHTPKDEDFPIHIHEEYEIFCFISGDAHYLVEGNEYVLEPGSLLVMRDTESHKVRIMSGKPYERFALHFHPKLLESVDPDRLLLEPFLQRPLGQNNLYRFSEFPAEQPLQLLEAMCGPADSEKERSLAVITHLYPLLHVLRNAYLQKQHDSENSSRSFAEEIVTYINLHLFEELSLSFLSRHFFLSTSQMERLFKKATGSSIWDYIVMKRLIAARNKIRSGMSSGTAAQECGFRDYSAFYRAYVRQFGASPQKDMDTLSHTR